MWLRPLELKRDKDSGEAALRACAKRKAKRELEQLKNRAQIVSIVKIGSFCYHVARVAKLKREEKERKTTVH